MYFASFGHAAGSPTITIAGNGSGCYLLTDPSEVNDAGVLKSFVAGNATAYGALTTASLSATASSPTAIANLAMFLGEYEGSGSLGALSESSGGGTPLALGIASISGMAQMWQAYQNIIDTATYGAQRALGQSGNGGGAIAILSAATPPLRLPVALSA